MPTARADVGVTGLATMGRNLARNLAQHGHTVAVHNRTGARTQALVRDFGDEGDLVPADDLAGLVASLRTPRAVIVMVKAGPGTDAVVDALAGLLEPGDVVVDGGNARYADTRRREQALRGKGVHFVGCGISGGEEGALLGPSIMPGGSVQAYERVGPLLEPIAAQVDGTPCCTHVGPDAAGHFVKMVHNGIEYADMQLIAEAYDLLRSGLDLTPREVADVFRGWNEGDLESFLVEITAEVLSQDDPVTGAALVDVIADRAEQKGTGRWTVQMALDLGVPVSGIAEAVFARSQSGHVEQRDAVRGALRVHATPWLVRDRQRFADDVREALYAAKVVAYTQGFDLIRAGSREYDWDVDLGAMARIWRGGCIIRARFLDRIREAYDHDPALASLLVAPAFAEALGTAEPALRRVVARAVSNGVPVPGLSAAVAAIDGLRRERLPAALVQGLRDLFGAHTYERVDAEGAYHLDWSGDRTQHRA